MAVGDTPRHSGALFCALFRRIENAHTGLLKKLHPPIRGTYIGNNNVHRLKRCDLHEGDLVDAIQDAYGKADGIVINPAAYTHTSVALLDALKAVGIPAVEVHISDVDEREAFRRISYVRNACVACIKGHGFEGYTEAIDLLIANGGTSL